MRVLTPDVKMPVTMRALLSRVVHVRVPEPILVDPARAASDGVEYARALLSTVHDRMQAGASDGVPGRT